MSSRRIARFFTILFVATTVLTVLAPLIGTSQKAYASGEKYVFYYPDDKDLIKQLQDFYDRGFNDGSPEKEKSHAEFDLTSVWSQGGIWGDQPVRMAYDKAASVKLNDASIGDGMRDHGYVYSVTYVCDEGKAVRGGGAGSDPDNGYYKVKLSRAIKIEVNNDDNRFVNQENYRSYTWISKIDKYPPKPTQRAGGDAAERNPKTYQDNGLWMDSGKVTESGINAAGCIPSFTTGDSAVNNTPNYYLPSPREGEWPNLVTADATKRSGDAVDTEDAQPNCLNGGSTLGVFICPMIDGLAAVSDWVFSTFIEGMLTNIPIGTDPDDGGFRAWQSFRLLGNIVLVGALLAMVFAQTFGERFIDAYALRKMAPRILVGAILINLSIYLGIAAADVVKVIGNGVGSLLTQPFIDGDSFDFTVGGSALTNAISTGAVLVGAGVLGGVFAYLYSQLGSVRGSDGVLAFVGDGARKTAGGIPWEVVLMWIFLFIVLPIVLLSIAILVTIAIRQGLLLFLIIIAPIAFACYVLPGTEKYFRTWWSTFSKTLMVYPIIAIIFAMSDVMSSLIFNANSGPAGILTGTIVMFLPLFLIPYSFRFAGGAIGAIYAASQGTLQKGNLLGRAQQSFGKARQDKDNFFGKKQERAKLRRAEMGLNAAQMLGAGAEAAGALRRGEGVTGARSAYRSAYRVRETDHGLHAIDELMQRKDFQQFDGNDDMLFALQHVLQNNLNPHQAREFLRTVKYGAGHEREGQQVFNSSKAVQDAEMAISRLMGGTTREVALDTAKLAQFGTGTGWGSGYELANGTTVNAGAGDAFAAMSEQAEGNLTKLVGLNRRSRDLAKKAERPDLLPGFTDSMDGLQRYMEGSIDASRGETERHYTDTRTGARVKWTREDLANWMVDSADRGHNAYQKYGQRKQAAEAFAQAARRRLDAAVEGAGNPGGEDALFAVLAELNGSKEVINSLAPQTREKITATLGTAINLERLKGIDVTEVPVMENYTDLSTGKVAQRIKIDPSTNKPEMVMRDLKQRLEAHLGPGAKTATNQEVLDAVNKGGDLWQRNVREWTMSDQAKAMGQAGAQPMPWM